MKSIKVVAMLSGGLDSTLAAKIVKGLGFEVLGVNFCTGFCFESLHAQLGDTDRCNKHRNKALEAGEQVGIDVELINVADDYLEIVKHPKHGYGSSLNPCIDCRIFMLKKAKRFMEEAGAEFVVTGEVLGQRPMSQHRKALQMILEESGLGDRLLRPLSAKLLPVTYPVKQGWIDQDDLYDIEGRSRKGQMELAEQFGIKEYPQPAGGCCMLLDKSYGAKVRDAFKHEGKDNLDRQDFAFLKVGRLFRLSDKAKVVVGRSEQENAYLEMVKNAGDYLIDILDYPSPLAVIAGDPTEEDLELAARITARYSDGCNEELVKAVIKRDEQAKSLEVKPLDPDDERLEKARV